MASGFDIPDTDDVSRMLTFLIGHNVKAKKASRYRPGTREAHALGVYVNGTNEPIGICLTDLGLAIHFGAALSHVPAVEAKKAIKARTIDPELWDHTLEVYSVISRFFHESHDGMVQLGPTFPDAHEISKDVKRLMRRSKRRADLIVDIEGYGKGTMSLIG